MGRRLIALAAAGMLVLAACGDDEGATDPVADPTEDADSPDDPGPAAEIDETEEPADVDGGEPGAAADLQVAETDLGAILVDGDGMTLYLFTADTDGTSSCTGECAEAWPPLTVEEAPVHGADVDEELVDTTTRDDGELQITYAGQPLYRYAADAQPGDTNGQGVGGAWFVVGPEGAGITDEGA